MAIFRPAKASGNGGGGFTGIKEASLASIVDKSDEKLDDGSKKYKWADIYLDVEWKIKDSQYTNKMQIAGSFDRDDGGNITGGSVVNRLYHFFDTIGYDGGINIKGEWEDKDGNKIDDISQALSSFIDNDPIEANYDYLIYIYKEQPKPGQDKAWTRVANNAIFKNQPGMQEKLQDKVNFLKSKNIIKEFNGVLNDTKVSFDDVGVEAL